MSLFSTEIDAKTASTTVSNDNQLTMDLFETTEWLIVGWGLCRGIKTASTSTIMVKNRVNTLFYVYLLLEKASQVASAYICQVGHALLYFFEMVMCFVFFAYVVYTSLYVSRLNAKLQVG
jgi:hypothetical protein